MKLSDRLTDKQCLAIVVFLIGTLALPALLLCMWAMEVVLGTFGVVVVSFTVMFFVFKNILTQ